MRSLDWNLLREIIKLGHYRNDSLNVHVYVESQATLHVVILKVLCFFISITIDGPLKLVFCHSILSFS